MGERILIIGGAGLLGRALLRHAPPGCEIEAPTRGELSLEDRPAIERVLNRQETTRILLTAAWTQVDDCEADPDRAFRTNAILPGRIARLAAARGIPLTYLSTDYVFAGEGRLPYREWDPVGPRSVYARSKWAGECEVRESSPNHRVVRTSGLYGAGGPDFVLAIVPRLRAGEVRIVDDQVLSPTWVDALAPAVWAVTLGGEAGTFHGTCKGGTSWFGFTRELAVRLGLDPERVRPIRTEELGRPAPRPAYSVLDGQRMKELLGIELPDWRESLAARLRLGDLGPGDVA